ncbi:Acetyl-coenzyme A synthetase protein [Rutstroemia sp. NJR-2017a WRK4]|nr:Acetyl-coenzyme A synthetase protein [Rutstroemia sp. NJR-2017a WRK4]
MASMLPTRVHGLQRSRNVSSLRQLVSVSSHDDNPVCVRYARNRSTFLRWGRWGGYLIYGPLLVVATTLIFEGTPAHPPFSRFWDMLTNIALLTFTLRPTALRILKRASNFHVTAPMKDLRVLGHIGQNRATVVIVIRTVPAESCVDLFSDRNFGSRISQGPPPQTLDVVSFRFSALNQLFSIPSQGINCTVR